MTTKRSKTKAKSGTESKSRRLTIKKETLKDLDAKVGKGVRGGVRAGTKEPTDTCYACSVSCLVC